MASPKPYATSHASARSVYVTLAWADAGDCEAASVQGYCALDMGTAFDEFTPTAHADATEGLPQQRLGNRWLLGSALEAGGLTVYSGEWWHFDTPDAQVAVPHLNVPVD